MKNTSRKPYIYKVTNLETGQYYIGSQCSGKIIGANYFTSSTNKAFKDGFKTHGEKYEIVIIKSFTDPKKCVRVENYIIRNYMQKRDGLCLNRAYCCNGEKIFSTVGLHHSEDARKRISEGHKGQPAWNKGIPMSEEHKKKLSLSKKGRPSPKKGIPISEEHKKKISGAMQGQPARNKGIPHSERAKQKMSLSHKKRIKISGTIFNSLKDASKYYNVSDTTIRNWAKTNKHNTVYVEKCPKI